MDTYGAIVLTAAFEGRVGSYWSPNTVNMYISMFLDGMHTMYVSTVRLLRLGDLQTSAVHYDCLGMCVCGQNVCVRVCVSMQIC